MYELDKPCIVYREDCPLYQKEGDGMTNEKAIEELKDIKNAYSNKQQFHEACLMRSEHEALDMAIKALEQEPSGDVVSRQAVIDAIGRVGMCKCSSNEIEAVDECLGVVKVLPPVNPQEPKADRGLHLSQQFKDWQFIQGQKADVLDKIRAEIEKPLRDERCFDTADAKAQYIALNWCIEIIDKYKAESDHKCHTCKHYMSGEYDGSCDSYICEHYSDWESEE